jgi:hypothetical protein
MRRSNPHTGKARRQQLCRALPPRDLAPSPRWQAKRKRLNRDRLVLAITPQQLWRSPLPRPVLGRLRPSTRRPYRRLWLDAGHIAQAKRRDAGPQISIGAIARVHQHHATRQPCCTSPAQLLKRDGRLRFEGDLFGHTSFAPTRTVRRPLPWQIKTMGNRQARTVIGNRKCHGDLTIVLLAELAAILTCHPDRMPPLLGEARVIDDPSFDRPVVLDRRQDISRTLANTLSSHQLPSPTKCN